ncbi:MAG: pitrilysin family protein [Candidatus Marinimicrobia bacterium]|nr:pitrilysin family protein [Candidatus Neomarinimicrobiota bacterium]
MKVMRTKSIHILLTLGFLATRIFAIDESKVREFTLNNGLKVLTYEMHSAPLIYSHLTYNVGSKYETFGQTGISHIVEHMMFKGTKRFQKGSIAELISANGGIFNAYTANDVTVYYELLPKNKIDLAFDIESERMFKCDFNAKEFKSEINVISEERRMRTENSYSGLRREEVNTLVYKRHPYRNPVIGWMTDIQSITRDQAYAYYRKYYTPNNATLVLAGDFDTKEIMQKVEKYYGRVPKGEVLEMPNFSDVAKTGKKMLKFTHQDLLNPEIQMLFSAPTRFQEDGAALYVMGSILCSRSATSRLHKRLVRNDRISQSVGGGLAFMKDPATFNIVASVLEPATIEQVEAAIWDEIDSVKNYPVDDADLEKIKNKLNFTELTENQYADQIGGSIGTYDNYVGWKYINKWPQMVKSVTKDDIMRVAKKYVVNENVVVCYSYPDSMKKDRKIDKDLRDETPSDFDAKSEESNMPADTIRMMPAKELGLFGRLFGREEKDVNALYFPKVDEVISPYPIKPLVDSLKLANGVTVYLIENHDYPTICLLGVIQTGRLEEEAQKPGIDQFTGGMLMRGADGRSFSEMLEERSFTPYQLDISQSWNQIVFQGYSLMKDSDKMLNALNAIITKPDFPQEEMEKVRPLLISSAKKFKQTETMKAFYAMFEKVFEGHQYALPYAGDIEVFQTLKREDIVNFYNKYYSPDRMKLVVIGDFSKNWVNEKLNATFGLWVSKSTDPMLSFTKIKPLKGKTVYVFSNPDYKQCRIDIGFNPIEGGITNDDPDLDALSVLEYILCGSSLTSRMGIELRDKQGLAYGIKSNLWIREHGGYWNIRTELDQANVPRMIRGIFKEIEKIQKYGVTDEELYKAKSRKIALLSYQTRTADDQGGVIFDAVRNDRSLDYFDKKRDRILSVTKEDVQRAAMKFLDTNNYVIGVSGNLDEEALDEFK